MKTKHATIWVRWSGSSMAATAADMSGKKDWVEYVPRHLFGEVPPEVHKELLKLTAGVRKHKATEQKECADVKFVRAQSAKKPRAKRGRRG